MKRQNKRLGQVFLHDNNIINKIVKTASPNHKETIIEIGCGDGILSSALAPHCNQLYIIEIDDFYLRKTKDILDNYSNIHYCHSDALDFDYSSLPKPYNETNEGIIIS